MAKDENDKSGRDAQNRDEDRFPSLRLRASASEQSTSVVASRFRFFLLLIGLLVAPGCRRDMQDQLPTRKLNRRPACLLQVKHRVDRNQRPLLPPAPGKPQQYIPTTWRLFPFPLQKKLSNADESATIFFVPSAMA